MVLTLTFKGLKNKNLGEYSKNENYQIIVTALHSHSDGLTLGEITDILRAERPERKFPKQHVLRILTEMMANELIRKSSAHNIPVYILTETGKAFYNNLWFIESSIRRMRNKRAGYMHFFDNRGIEHDYIFTTQALQYEGIKVLIGNEPKKINPIAEIVKQSLLEKFRKHPIDLTKFNDETDFILVFHFNFKVIGEYLKNSGDSQ